MPHFVAHCSEAILSKKNTLEILTLIHETALSTGLFAEADIKVRLQSFETYLVGGKPAADFIHVFANIMQGRTTEQKANLSKKIVAELKKMFPEVEVISINVRDFEKATYYNKTMI